ncbi:cubilin-like [Pieris brassicae]|uniref:cubilin-like n=1 Tax=Pieris brassicae TaxID=7116 RepID=UPI001E66051D|nr:cubilin-like [Pieris brassicae]
MTYFFLKLLFLILCIVRSKSDIYKNRPKIKTADGDLIIESSYNKNIYLKPNGPRSSIFVGNINVLDINITKKEDIWKPSFEYSNSDRGNKIADPNDIIGRIERLESFSTTLPSTISLNVTYLTRQINTLRNRIRTIHSLINRKGKEECQSHPCENGGTCLNLVNGYYCLCPSNWKGVNCDEDVNECRNYAGTDLGCQNGATCINRPGSYECICKPGWFGLHCTRKERNCTGNDFEICGHGTCLQVTTGVGIKCLCDQGWTTNDTSIACLTDVNECLSSQGPRCSVNPPVDCINLPGSFVCGSCPVGYEGDGYVCHDVDECLTLPNGGCSLSPRVSCHNTIGSRLCGSCPPGFEGDGVTCTWRGSCSINSGGCHPSAQCIEIPGYGGQIVQCVCPRGMSGDGIGTNGCFVASNKLRNGTGCENNPCGANGVCHQLRYGYTCICDEGYGGVHCDIQAGICSNNPCLNGGTCRSNGRLARRFRCECTAMFTGDLCQLRVETCGGVLDAEEGSIIYPPTNTTYRPNARCAWVIHTSPDKVINVTFSKFHLEHHAECYYDFVQIHDGRSSASQLVGRFCGTDLPKGGNIISSHNNLYFWFRSDQTISAEGFALHWNSISPICGGVIDATQHGRVNSPGSPGPYPPNRDCYWRLNTNLGKRIQLHFFQLDLETHPNCSFDYLAIYDGLHVTDPLLNKYCNSSQPAPVQSSSPEILIHFHSDAYGSGKGFQITYAPVEGVPGCGGFYTADKGEITSPSYNNKYLNNLICDYKIQTSPETKVRLTFRSFNLERSFRCRFDYIVIYDGPNEDSKLIGKFCGNSIPKTYTSSSNSLFIRFKSDQSISSGGFKVAYESICHKTIMGDSGIIKSPGYPFKYPKNTVCEYVIGTSPGKIIQLSFQDFDIEDNRFYNCQYDYVEVRDGPTSNSSLLGRYCGGSDHIPPIQTSSFNYLFIGFHSDMSISGTGFFANYTTLDIECGGIYRETTGLINYPASGKVYYSNDQSCTWVLIAPEAMHIKLTWNRFDTETQFTCENDFLELIEIDDDYINGTSLGKYCGKSLPPALTTTSNKLMLKFQSDKSVSGLGFSLSYSFLDEKSHCGGVYIKTSGYIYSPGWPDNYEPNKDCTWTITVPEGQQIALKIKDFDLEMPIREKCDLGDYLLIRDGSSDSASLLAKLCGSFKTKRIVSTAHNLYIHFHSDFYLSGKGFSIEWDGALRGCGGTLTSVAGSISSPNYPQNYNDDAECFYKIVTSSGSRIRIVFADLDLEQTMNCRDDYVEIYDGRDVYAPSLGRFCELNNNQTSIETKSNYAFIKFRSDVFLGGKGFLLNYETICNTNISGSYGVIESPGYPNNYPLSLNCLWNITVGLGNRINVTFTHFNIFSFQYRPRLRGIPPWNRYQSPWVVHSRPFHFSPLYTQGGTQCESYLQFKELTEEIFSNKHCGTSLPAPISTKSNSMQINFVSGYFNAANGFRLEWVKDGCGAYLKKQRGEIELPKNIKYSKNGLECEWVIETQPGSRVTVILNDVFVEETKNCTVDSIEFYNGQSSSSHLISKICHRGSNTIQSSSNYIFIKFVKKSSLRDVYFSAYYDSDTSGCGGGITSRTGVITSENYPKNYNDNMDCLWYITVPDNHRIELNFLDLDLYSVDDDDESYCGDSIKIYENSYIANSNYTHLICPQSNISQIITNTPYMVLQFTSDSFGSAKGFKANFSATCGAVIEAKYDGVITNDRFISQNRHNCTWVILSHDLGEKIKLTVEHMSIPRSSEVMSNKECPSSFLKFFDGNDINSPVIGEYCGYKVPSAIVSHGSALTIMHGTYGDTLSGSFTAHYSTLSNACGGTISSEEGSIASPNYPLSYPLGTDCDWTLRASPGNSMYITFEAFNIVYSDRCNEDYLEIRENNGGGRLLGVYCGETLPVNTTTGSAIYIKFHSGYQNSGTGFLAHFGILHQNEITDKSQGEISSPLYPHPYNREGEFSWRIIGKLTSSITLNIDELVIPKRGEACDSKLIIYDGYDEEAPIVGTVCGIIRNQDKIFNTRSSLLYIRFVIAEPDIDTVFNLKWYQSQSDLITTESGTLKRCGYNESRVIAAGAVVNFYSPKYPEEYGEDLLCEWMFEATVGHHLQLNFNDFKLEETSACYADHVSIYSRNLKEDWKLVKENLCLFENVKQGFEISQVLKVMLQTDSSIAGKGFSASVTSKCGGVISKESGTIEFSWGERDFRNNIRCNWTIKVRPGRTVKINFEHFNITNEHECNQYVMIRNGESSESPLLGTGKFCGYSHEVRESLISSGNAIYVSYVSNNHHMSSEVTTFETFKLRFEEKNIECGSTSAIDSDNKWEVISSPNYPSVPMPYSECVWVLTGPPGEKMRIDFIDRFDIDGRDDCIDESIEVHDGGSVLAPTIGVYCGTKPGTVRSSSNALYIKYSTMLSEPRNGFKANISTDVCGGTIIADSGEITSPGYPHMLVLPAGSLCKWHIISPLKNVIKFYMVDFNIPESRHVCQINVTVMESLPMNKTASTLMEFCSDAPPVSTTVTETSSNEATISFFVGDPSSYTQISEYKGFKMTFNSSRPSCGGKLTQSEGYLTTPGYPRTTSLRYCQWFIVVPDATRRVKLELIDYNENERIGIYNDATFESLIDTYSGKNISGKPLIYESSGNTIAVYLLMKMSSSQRYTQRFKARFTSDEPALCGVSLHGTSGKITAPDLQRSYVCKWTYNFADTYKLSNYSDFNTMFISITNTFSREAKCYYSHSRLIIDVPIENTGQKFTRTVCGNQTELSYRIPLTSLTLRAIQLNLQPILFNVEWKLQPCGGVVHLSQESRNILNIPKSFNDTLDCGWIVIAPPGVRIETSIEGIFNHDCSDEFLTVHHGLTQSLSVLEYCKNKIPEKSIVTSFMNTYIQYHSKAQKFTNLKLVMKVASSQCGGYLDGYERIFSSPNYPNHYDGNIECTWVIQASIGYRVSLSFFQRFVVEDTVNCTKDAVIIYDWINGSYQEMAKLCGREIPPIYNSTSTRMKVVFRTDSNINLDGFIAEWTQICGGVYTATNLDQFIYSPGYGIGYGPLLDCSYEILAPTNNKLVVKFQDFSLEGIYPECKFDNLTVNGKREYEFLVKIFCGKHIPPILENYEKVMINFKTDRIGQDKGFKLSYSLYKCGGKITEPTRISTGSAEEYFNGLNCSWLIEAPSDKVVIVNFAYIDIEPHFSCSNDYIAVFDGSQIENDHRLALLCGKITSSTVIKSNSSRAIVQFVSDDFLNYKGFQAQISFSHGEAVGCGGVINLLSPTQYSLKSPRIANSFVYENYLDCHWFVKAPEDHVVKVEFTAFHVSPCAAVNQTAIGIRNCRCDFVEIRDGLNPDSLLIDKFCGHTLPPAIVSSTNVLSIRLSTDGEIVSSGFEISLSLQSSRCFPTEITVDFNVQKIHSPGFGHGDIPRGLHCKYILKDTRSLMSIHLRVNYIDLEPGTGNHCINDKLIITSVPQTHNLTIGKNYILNENSNNFFLYSPFYDPLLMFPEHFVLCGSNKSLDFYLHGNIKINLITSAETALTHKGVELEVAYINHCGGKGNYTEPYGHIVNSFHEDHNDKLISCSTLITAPENYTISIYINELYPSYFHDTAYFEILDGDKLSSPSLFKVESTFNMQSVSSTGRYLLLHTVMKGTEQIIYNINYLTTDKGRGCGGKLVNELGRITSPMYPEVYRKRSTCEWELETPIGTQLRLHFSEFDLGVLCDQNYVSLVDRKGNFVSSYCSETPADYTSEDNYVKVVYTTTMSNGGTGWIADFVGILDV